MGSETHDVAAPATKQPTRDELLARIAEMEAAVAAAKKQKAGTIEFRVGAKGGVSVYGLGRFPVTLYYEQWLRLLDSGEGLRSFLDTNKSTLKMKPSANE
jgi:hypothetical protein